MRIAKVVTAIVLATLVVPVLADPAHPLQGTFQLERRGAERSDPKLPPCEGRFAVDLLSRWDQLELRHDDTSLEVNGRLWALEVANDETVAARDPRDPRVTLLLDDSPCGPIAMLWFRQSGAHACAVAHEFRVKR